MNDELTAIRPDPALSANVTQLHGDAFLGHAYHRAKRMHSVLIGKIAGRDEVFSIAEAIGNSSEEMSGKIAHQAKLMAGTKTHKPEDNILNAFGRIKDISR